MGKQKFGFSGESSVLNKISNSLGQWWYIFFAAVGSAVISISASFAGAYNFCEKWEASHGILKSLIVVLFNPWSFILLGSIAIIYGGKGTFIDLDNLNSKNKKLEKENLEVNSLKERINSVSEDSVSLQNQLSSLHTQLVTTWLKSCFRNLKLTTNERVTIYYHVDNHFYVLARHSQNPMFSVIHRQKFSVNHGVISKAWGHRECVDIDGCPLYSNEPNDYKQYMKDTYGYKESSIETLAMKSCQFIAVAIVEADNPVGVIVFESDNHNKFKAQKISQIKKYCSDYQSYMVNFIAGGVKYDKSARVAANASTEEVEEDFLSKFI